MRYTPKKNKTAKLISFACVLIACALVGTVFLRVRYQAVYETLRFCFIFLALSFFSDMCLPNIPI